MQEGKIKFINWNNYISPYFIPPKKELEFDENINGSCGTYALHVLTKIPFKTLEKEFKRSNQCWTDKRMLRFLRERGYTVIPLTLGNTCAFSPIKKKKITSKHVILCSQHFCKTEGTWTVLYENIEYHSGEFIYFLAIDQFNTPIDTAYVIWHPKWSSKSIKETKLFGDWDSYVRALWGIFLNNNTYKIKRLIAKLVKKETKHK